MTIILTNDDGIDAPGIKALIKAVNGKNVIIAAPAIISLAVGIKLLLLAPSTSSDVLN